jgi:hypothetical protein
VNKQDLKSNMEAINDEIKRKEKEHAKEMYDLDDKYEEYSRELGKILTSELGVERIRLGKSKCDKSQIGVCVYDYTQEWNAPCLFCGKNMNPSVDEKGLI